MDDIGSHMSPRYLTLQLKLPQGQVADLVFRLTSLCLASMSISAALFIDRTIDRCFFFLIEDATSEIRTGRLLIATEVFFQIMICLIADARES